MAARELGPNLGEIALASAALAEIGRDGESTGAS
jgi:hypothetical protein